MNNQIEFQFPDATLAYRFLHHAQHLKVDGIRVKLGRDDSHVLVSYRLAIGAFDSTLDSLDKLAEQYEGSEAS